MPTCSNILLRLPMTRLDHPRFGRYRFTIVMLIGLIAAVLPVARASATTWMTLSAPGAVSAMVIDPRDTSRLYVSGATPGFSGVARSDDGGATWAISNLGVGIRTLALDPFNPDKLCVGTEDRRIRCSLDRGGSWGPARTVPLPSASPITILAFHPSIPGVLFALGDGTEAGVTSAGVYRSSDDGVGWQKTATGIQATIGNGIAFDPANPNIVYVAMQGTSGIIGGVFQSTDAGVTWNATGLAGTNVSRVAVDPGDSTILYAFAGLSVYRSTNQGQSWSTVPAPGPLGLFVVSAHTPTAVYLWGSGGGDKIYDSRNGGTSWQVYFDPASIGAAGGFSALALDPGGTELLYIGSGSTIYRQVLPPIPTITGQPLNQRVRPGTTVTLDVTPGGSPTPITFQWYEGQSGDTTHPVAGATSRTFTPPALTINTAFWVRLSNVAGSVDSTTASVQLKGPYDVTLDGFNFINYVYTPGTAIPGSSWDIFKRTFPNTRMTTSTGRVRFGVQAFFQSPSYQQIGAGNCAGLSSVSLLRYVDAAEPVERDVLNPFYRRFTQVNDLPDIFPGNVRVVQSNVKDYVFLYQARQLSREWAIWLRDHKNDTPIQTFNAATTSTQSQTPVGIVIYYPQSNGQFAGHMLVAYATQTVGSTGFISVYDPNWPNDTTRKITVDLNANSWQYTLGGTEIWSGTHDLRYVPASVLSSGSVPALYDVLDTLSGPSAAGSGEIAIEIQGGAQALVTDSQGHRLGYANGVPVDEIPGAVRLPSMGFNPQNPDAPASETLYLPTTDTYTATVAPIGATSTYTMTAFGSGSALTIAGASVAPGQPDQLVLHNSVLDTTFTPATDGNYCAAVTREQSDSISRQYTACVSNGAGIAAKAQINPATGAYTLQNTGNQPFGVTLTTEQVGILTGDGTVTQTLPAGGILDAPPPLVKVYLPLVIR